MLVFAPIIAFWAKKDKSGLCRAVCAMLHGFCYPLNSMHIEHFEKGIRYNDKELLILARRLGKMATYCGRLKDESSVIRVEAERREAKKQDDTVKVMITITLPQKVLRAESRKKTAIEAIDRVVEKLEPQLIKYKELRTRKGRVRKARKTSRARDLAA